MNNRELLMEIISDNSLERRDVAEMLKVKTDEVDSWLLSAESKNHTPIPDMAIELLQLKMAMSSAPAASED